MLIKCKDEQQQRVGISYNIMCIGHEKLFLNANLL